jgi:hypothetical protein
VPEFLHVTMFTIDQTFTYAFEKKRPEEITNKVITFIKFGKVSMLYGCYISFSCTLGGFVCLFLVDWSLNSKLHTCKAGALPLHPHPQFILLWLFWRWGLANYLFRLASNCDSPDLCLHTIWDYRHELPVPSWIFVCLFFRC